MNAFLPVSGPLPGRPLNGLTVLVVEDSRFACDAMRLMCLRSGARIRRADCLRSARRHLQTYRPTVVVVDLGLPDGSGLDLIAELAALHPRVPALLATSGDIGLERSALAAGADGFLAKPLESLAVFQSAILAALPDASRRPITPSAGDLVRPDMMALRDDLAHAAELLRAAKGAEVGYVAQFLSGLGRSAHDSALSEAAASLAHGQKDGLSRLSGLVADRLAAGNGGSVL
ncbi:MAG: response regulator [Paracoccaceae bacterium]